MNINLLRSVGTITQFKKDQIVFMQNDSGENMYIVLMGTFGVYINSFTDFPCRVVGIEKGSFFGEMSVIDGWPRSATIISETEGAAIMVEKKDFAHLLEKSPDISANILEMLKNRATTTIDAVRKAGKDAQDLSGLLLSAQVVDADRTINYMKMLAQRIRQLNNMLGEANEPAPPIFSQTERQDEPKKLLPQSYTPFVMRDKNENAAKLQKKTVSCPYCNKESEAFIPLFSNLVQQETTLDQRVIYKDFEMLWYTNIVCPNCNYTDTYQEFINWRKDNTVKFTGNQFINSEGFTGFSETHNHKLDDVMLSYYLAVYCTEQTTNDPLRLAKAWMRIYWLYKDRNRKEMAQTAAENAARYYKEYSALNDDNMGTEDKMRVNLILGELYAFCGECTKAMEHFKENTVIGSVLGGELTQQSLRRYREIKKDM